MNQLIKNKAQKIIEEYLHEDFEKETVFFDGSLDKEKAYVFHHRKRFFSLLNYLFPKIKKEFRILDVGASPFSFILKRIFPDVDLVTVDFTEDFKERCKKYRIKFVKHDLTKFPFPFPDNYFDLIIFGEVLEHLLTNHSVVMSELERILNKGGTLIIQTPNAYSLNRRIDFLLGKEIFPNNQKIFDYQYAGKLHIFEYKISDLIKLIKDSTRFKIIKISYATYYDNLESALVYKKFKLFYILPALFYFSITRIVPCFRRGIEVILIKQ